MRASNLKFLILLWLLFFVFSCSKDDDNGQGMGTGTQASTSPNILFVIADDLGRDAISGYVEGLIKPTTPNLDAIRNDGLTFNNFWVNPTCSPTRSAIITGKYGYRTNLISVGDMISSSETLLHEYISDNTNQKYANALIGKWHLSGGDNTINPETFGVDYFAGIIRGSVPDYYDWDLNESGSTSNNTGYTTEVLTDLSIDWINAQDKPWFLWLAYNAPHTPFHVPPDNMHSQGELAAYTDAQDPLPYFMAAIEAMDFQIGRLIDSIPADELDNTVIIFIGDNGSPNQVAQSPYLRTRAKGSLYQGGINVPMFASGAVVTCKGIDNNLITGTDLFATISNLAGINVTEYHDSKSFASLFTADNNAIRQFQYSEENMNEDKLWTISDGQFKLINNTNGNDEFYKLSTDPYEINNLLDANLTAEDQDAKTNLEAELALIRQ